MQGQHHPLQGVGYSDRPTPFDHLSRVAMAHGQQQSQQQQPATHAVHPAGSTSTSGQSKRRPASSNGEWGPSPPEHANGSGHARPFKKSRKSSSVVAEGDSTSTLALVPGPGTNEAQQQKKRAKQVLSCSECKVSREPHSEPLQLRLERLISSPLDGRRDARSRFVPH